MEFVPFAFMQDVVDKLPRLYTARNLSLLSSEWSSEAQKRIRCVHVRLTICSAPNGLFYDFKETAAERFLTISDWKVDRHEMGHIEFAKSDKDLKNGIDGDIIDDIKLNALLGILKTMRYEITHVNKGASHKEHDKMVNQILGAIPFVCTRSLSDAKGNLTFKPSTLFVS